MRDADFQSWRFAAATQSAKAVRIVRTAADESG
jgi:hypothetical protein